MHTGVTHTYVRNAHEELPLTYTNPRCIIEIKEVISMYVIRDEDNRNTKPNDPIPKANCSKHPLPILKKSKSLTTILDTPEGTFLFSPQPIHHTNYQSPYTINVSTHAQHTRRYLPYNPQTKDHSYKENYHMLLHAPDITEWNPETSIIKPMITFPYMNFIITKRKVLNHKKQMPVDHKNKQTNKLPHIDITTFRWYNKIIEVVT